MTPDHLRALSLYSDVEALFERAKRDRHIGLGALPEERIAALLVERLAPLLAELDDYCERIAGPLDVERHDLDATVMAMPSRRLERALKVHTSVLETRGGAA